MITTVNPATGQEITTYQLYAADEVDSILHATHTAQKHWKKTGVEKRAQAFERMASVLERRKEELARQMTLEMGKPISEARAEIDKCIWACQFYAEFGAKFLRDYPIKTDAKNSYINYQPLGIVLGIMPWNFPFWQAFRYLVPTLVAGNGSLLKHAEVTTESALQIEALFDEAEFPKNLVRTVLVSHEQISELIADSRISAVTLTGSTRAGKIVAAQAGKHLKKTVMELGGSDPCIVLKDADLQLAVQKAAKSRLINSGQSCIAAKRFIVEEAVYDEFRNLFIQELQSYSVGDPGLDSSQIGPLARLDLKKELHRQVAETIERGGTLLFGGHLNMEAGFYPVTLLENVSEESPAYREELFGPVATLIKAFNQDEAIRIANDTNFGLGASLFSRDLKNAERIAAEELEAGCCFVNDFVRSDPRLPFGGVKESGFGRELSMLGIREFVNAKTVFIS